MGDFDLALLPRLTGLTPFIRLSRNRAESRLPQDAESMREYKSSMDKHLTTPAHCRESDRDWQEKTLQPFLQSAPERLRQFTSVSGTTVRRLYTLANLHAHLQDIDFQQDVWLSGPAFLHSRYSPHHVPQEALDHSGVQRVRHV